MHAKPAVVAAKNAVADVRSRMAGELAADVPAATICARASDAFERIVVGLWDAVVAGLPAGDAAAIATGVSLVAHGGFGRRQMAPWSDIDVSIVHRPEAAALVPSVARPFLQDLFDAGLDAGASVRTPAEARDLARRDASVHTALLDARHLAGEPAIAAALPRDILDEARRDPAATAARFSAAREAEMRRHGGTPALLEPNVKRSAGGLRDLQLLRWLGTVLHGMASPEALVERGVLAADDAGAIHAAEEFLLRVRIALHLAEGRAADDLTRPRQARLAASWGHASDGGLLAVERFMREYIGHTRRVMLALESVLPESDGGDVVILDEGPCPRVVPRRPTGACPPPGEPFDDAVVVRLVGDAARQGLPIDRGTWRAIRAGTRQQDPGDDARAAFLAMFDHPAGLGRALRLLHEVRLLERLVPPFRHARNLLQFNDYHKYTVDEHCILAVERVVGMADGGDWLAETWDHLTRRRPLLVALLLHDLGKGHPEDHSVLGARMARETATRLGLPPDEVDVIEFLVLEHLSMAQLAFRRDAGDDSLVLPFARRTGSPETLRMLSLLTAADVAAVGPDTWTRWKSDLLADVAFRTLACLDGETGSGVARRRREELRAALDGHPSDDPVRALADALPDSAFVTVGAERLLGDLERIARLTPEGILSVAEWRGTNGTVAVTVATRDHGARAFHRATAALTAQRLTILAADVHPLGAGTVARFTVTDGDFDGEPPSERLAEIAAAIRAAWRADAPPVPARRWNPFAPRVAPSPPRVVIDNESSARTTIVEVFARDAPGLLSDVARTLSEAGLSVRSARVATRLDQVVDAFHVTDAAGAKLTDAGRITALKTALERVVAPLTGPG